MVAVPRSHEDGPGISGYWEYDTDLFDEETILGMQADYSDLIRRMAADPDAPLMAGP